MFQHIRMLRNGFFVFPFLVWLLRSVGSEEQGWGIIWGTADIKLFINICPLYIVGCGDRIWNSDGILRPLAFLRTWEQWAGMGRSSPGGRTGKACMVLVIYCHFLQGSPPTPALQNTHIYTLLPRSAPAPQARWAGNTQNSNRECEDSTRHLSVSTHQFLRHSDFQHTARLLVPIENNLSLFAKETESTPNYNTFNILTHWWPAFFPDQSWESGRVLSSLRKTQALIGTTNCLQWASQGDFCISQCFLFGRDLKS